MPTEPGPKLRCCKTFPQWSHHQCSKPVKVTVGGKHYCAIHSPEGEAARQKKSDARYQAWSQKWNKDHRDADIAALKAKHFDHLLMCAKSSLSNPTAFIKDEIDRTIKIYERALATLEKSHAH